MAKFSTRIKVPISLRRPSNRGNVVSFHPTHIPFLTPRNDIELRCPGRAGMTEMLASLTLAGKAWESSGASRQPQDPLDGAVVKRHCRGRRRRFIRLRGDPVVAEEAAEGEPAVGSRRPGSAAV